MFCPVGRMGTFALKKLLKLSLILLFTFGVLIQLNSCFVEYFQYQIISRIKMKKEPQRMPMVTVCPSTFRGPIMFKLRPEPMNVRFNLTPSYSDYVKSCVITLPSNRQVNCSQVTNVTEYIGPLGKCFSFFRSDRLKVHPSQLLYHETDFVTKDYLTITIDSPFDENIGWMEVVNSPDEPLTLRRRDISKRFFEVNLFKELKNEIKYEEKYRLPPPYHDGCFEYSKTELRTRNKAIYDCINYNYKNATSKQGYWHLFAMIEFGKEFVNESTTYLEEQQTQRKSIFPQIIHQCSLKYRRNQCDQKSYGLNIVGTKRGAVNNSEIVIKFVNLPFDFMHSLYMPVFSVLDFVNTVGGVFSLWFSASLFTWFLAGAEKVTRKKSRKLEKPCQFVLKVPTKNFDLTKGIQFFIVSVCSLGCIIQCFDIGRIYVEDNFYVWISGVEPEQIHFPRLTFCVDMVLLPEKVASLFPKVYNTTPLAHWPDNFTIDEMFDVTINLEDIFIPKDNLWESSFISPSLQLIPILSEYTFDKELTDQHVCFSTFSPHNHNGSTASRTYSFSQISSSFYFMLFLKKLSANFTDELKIFMHLGNSFSMGKSSPSQITVVNGEDRFNPSLIYFSINEIRQILVSNSFGSKCFVYHSINFDSQEDAIQSCIRSVMKKKYKLWPNDIPVSREKGSGLKFATDDYWNESQSVGNFCNKKFPLQACDGRYTSLQLVDLGFHPNYTQIILYPPPDSYTEIRQGIRFTLTQLMVYIGSNVNAWLGLSMIDLFTRFK